MNRYLLLKLGPIVLIVNALVNVIAANILCPSGHTISINDVVKDTLIASFLIGFVTVLTVMPGARREAWSGRVAGEGKDGAGPDWAKRHPFILAILAGLFTIGLWGCLAVLWLHEIGIQSLSHDAFMVFKTTFACVVGLFVAWEAAGVAIGGEPEVQWSGPPGTNDFAYPFDYIDKGSLAMTDNARRCSGTPTWQLVVDGRLDPEHVLAALRHLVARYPTLTMRVQALDGVPPWAARFRYVQIPTFRVEDVFRAVDVDDIDAFTREEINRPLDPFTEPLWSLTLANTGPDSCRLCFRQHHMIADGRAFIGFLADFAGFLNTVRAEQKPLAVELLPVHRRSEIDALGFSRGRRAWETFAGYGALARAIGHAVLHPVAPLLQNRSNDYSGESGTVHWSVSNIDGWHIARKKIGVSLNSLLTGALFAATQRSQQPVGRTNATLVMETRPRDGTFASFANHLATLVVELPLDRVTDPAAMVRSIQQQVDEQRRRGTPIKRLLCERQLFTLSPLADMQKLVFETKRTTYNLNFSNLIPLRFPDLGGPGWHVRDVLITTPVLPRNGIVVTAIQYGGRVTFNFNYKSSAATREQAQAFAEAFAAVLGEVAGAEEPLLLAPSA